MRSVLHHWQMIGRLETRPADYEGYGVASLRFEVPNVPPGDYMVSHCNVPCRTQLGDLVPTMLRIVGTPAEGRILGHFDEKSEALGHALLGVERRIERDLRRSEQLFPGGIVGAEHRMLDRIARASGLEPTAGVHEPWLVVAFGGGVVLSIGTVALRKWRRKERRDEPVWGSAV